METQPRQAKLCSFSVVEFLESWMGAQAIPDRTDLQQDGHSDRHDCKSQGRTWQRRAVPKTSWDQRGVQLLAAWRKLKVNA